MTIPHREVYSFAKKSVVEATEIDPIEHGMLINAKLSDEFCEKLLDPALKLPFTAECIRSLQTVLGIRLSGMDLAVEQVKTIGSFLRNKHLSGTILAYLVCGLIPTDKDDISAGRVRTLYGMHLMPFAEPVRNAEWILRKWSRAEENTGLVDFIDFFVWCDENDIDTSYLRLMRELTGCGASREIGLLPLTQSVSYGRSF